MKLSAAPLSEADCPRKRTPRGRHPERFPWNTPHRGQHPKIPNAAAGDMNVHHHPISAVAKVWGHHQLLRLWQERQPLQEAVMAVVPELPREIRVPAWKHRRGGRPVREIRKELRATVAVSKSSSGTERRDRFENGEPP
jgi:hypothetical protein